MKPTKLQAYNKELAKIKKDHPNLPKHFQRMVASDHIKHPTKKRD